MHSERTVSGLTAKLLATVGVLALSLAAIAASVGPAPSTDQASMVLASSLAPNAFFNADSGDPGLAFAPAATSLAGSTAEADTGLVSPAPSVTPAPPAVVGATSALLTALAPGRSDPAVTAVPATATAVPAPATAVPATATAVPATATAVPATATAIPATAVPRPAPVSSHVQRGQAVLSRVSYDWRALGYSITFHPPRRGYRGLTFPYENRIEIYVDAAISDSELAHVIAHEIGHAVDVVRNSSSDRQAWLAARGLSASTAWWAGDGVSDFASGSGDFAECFAAWQVGSPTYSRLNPNCAGTAQLVSQLASS